MSVISDQELVRIYYTALVMSYIRGHYSLHTCHRRYLLSVILLLSMAETKASSVTYVHNGATCMKCPLGKRVLTHCSRDTQTTCQTCEDGTYQSQEFTALDKCGDCDQGCPDSRAVIVQNCTPEHNLQCACADGYYNRHHVHDVMACVPYSECPRGQIIVREGDAVKDVSCGWCPRDQFYNQSAEECSTCTTCTQPHTTAHTCTRTRNTVCLLPTSTIADITTHGPVSEHPLNLAAIIAVSVVAAGACVGCVVCLVCHGRKRSNKRKRQREKDMNGEELSPCLSTPSSDASVWKQQVFLELSSKVRNFDRFYRNLPPPGFDADLMIDRTKDFQGSIEDRYYGLLDQWYQCCYNDATIDAIVQALDKSSNSNLTQDIIQCYNQAVIPAQTSDTKCKDRNGSSEHAHRDSREEVAQPRPDNNEVHIEMGGSTINESRRPQSTINIDSIDAESSHAHDKDQTHVKSRYGEISV